MAGYLPNQQRRRAPDPYVLQAPQEGCDLEFNVDLVGVNPAVSADLEAGDRLSVKAIAKGEITCVVCTDDKGRVVGTLAAFRGLAQLINCIAKGATYAADIYAVTRTRCAVTVTRAES